MRGLKARKKQRDKDTQARKACRHVRRVSTWGTQRHKGTEDT